MSVNKAIILCAGKGTRLLPYTRAVPKCMLAVADKPVLQLVIEEVVASGIKCFTDYALKNEIIGKDYLNYLVELTNKKQ